ncbi:amidohydrolase [Spiractinospora alimapuensis]|uniref:amidohydrolase family protein n=1 Tax=Spiractinospora alimapuensis TaxID=2820884 RepID=UPI001F1EB2AE|nr:amidohydrolase family protein [Spiractinospora alimapuensis]QVQ50021.1 amidohydrolase [Spiractinospora alimapuensis]
MGAVEERDARAEADIAPVRAFWRDLGVPGLVDVHTHFMPDRMLRKVWAFFDQVTGPDGTGWPIMYRSDEDDRLARLRDYGLRTFSALSYPHKPGMASWLNTYATDFAARVPESLHSATFYPEPDAADYVKAVIGEGARVFKAHVQVGAYDPRDPLLEGVWRAIADAEVPVVIHCGSGPHPGAFTGPGPVREILRRHPRLRLVVAHMGMPEYSEFLDLVEEYPGAYLDTTMAFTPFTEAFMPFPRQELARLRALGDRILFGSDFPNIPYRYIEALEALARLDLGSDWLRAVCHDNGAALFDLPDPRNA